MSSNTKQHNTTRIYLDNSASTAVDERVLAAMEPYWRNIIGNAGSIHKEGRDAQAAVEDARAVVAKALHTLPGNIIFTSGGTESNNQAIQGVVRERVHAKYRKSDLTIVTSQVEHKSILDTFSKLEEDEVHIVCVPTDAEGKVNLEVLEESIKEGTVLISLIYVNNEIGTIQDIESVMRIVRKHRKQSDSQYPLVHLDASQAPAWVGVHTEKLGVDFISLDSQKLYGPKGVGCLYVRDREMIHPILYGGGQEMGLRPGTPPTPLIVGFARALELVEEERDSYVTTIGELRDWCIEAVQSALPGTVINGPLDEWRIAGNISFSFPDIEGEQLVIELDAHGIATSTGSACLSEETAGSHVIKALCKEGIDPNGTLRITMSRTTTRTEIETATKQLIETVNWLTRVH